MCGATKIKFKVESLKSKGVGGGWACGGGGGNVWKGRGKCERGCDTFAGVWWLERREVVTFWLRLGFGTRFAISGVEFLNKPINTSVMNIRPLADRVLILPAPAEEKTVGGIIIPDSAKEKPLRGKVVAVGGGTKDEEMVLKAGDEVLYGKYAGTELEYEGEKYLIMRQSDVLAIL